MEKNMVSDYNKPFTLRLFQKLTKKNSTFRQNFLASKFWGSQELPIPPPASFEAGAGKKQDGAIEGSRLGPTKFLGGGTAVDGNQKSGVH